MTSKQIKQHVTDSQAASFWLKDAITKAATRDCLDALKDAEALMSFCLAQARESGINC